MFLLGRFDIFSFFPPPRFFFFATAQWFPEVTNWAQRRQTCKCLNLVALQCPMGEIIFLNSLRAFMCIFLKVNCIYTHFSSARGNCNRGWRKNNILPLLHCFLFPRTFTTWIYLQGLFPPSSSPHALFHHRQFSVTTAESWDSPAVFSGGSK